MFCKNCGKELKTSQKFCTGCGSAAPVKPSTPEFEEESSGSGVWSKINRSRVIQVLVVLAFVGLGIWGSMDDEAVKKNNNAITAFDTGSSQQAIIQLQDASQSAVSNENKINTLKNLAYVYSSEGQEDQALSKFKEALQLASKNSFDYYLISGEVAERSGDPESAYSSFNNAYRLNSEDFQINNALALFHLDMESKHPQYEDYKKALPYAQKAAQLSTLQAAKQNLAIAYYMNKNYDQAISILSTLTLDKDSYTAYWIGLAYLNKEDHVNAKIYLQKAMDNGVTMPQEITDYLNSN